MADQGKGSEGQEVSWKYLLFLSEMALAMYQKTLYRINVHSFIVEVKLKRRRWIPRRRGGYLTLP